MAKKIMESGDSVSKIFRPKSSFGIFVKSSAGSIAGDWLVYLSPNGTDWEPAHDTPFSDTKKTDVLDIPAGFMCRVSGGTGTNLEVWVGYMPNAIQSQISIDNDVEE